MRTRRITEYSAAIVPAETGPDDARLAMQREADGPWAELADSWNLRAVKAFKTRFPEAEQAAEANRRIAFLIQRHNDAQAELNRLSYEAGPVDGIWGLRSIRAMRAFQSDNGLAPDGIVSEALLDRLKTAAPKIAAPAAPTPEPQPQPGRPEAEVAVVSPSAQDDIPDDSRWTASGESRDGSKILAIATRRDDTLTLVFDVDHWGSTVSSTHFSYHYTQSCTILVADPVFECWIPGRYDITISAKVFGTFPRLQFSFMQGFARYGSGASIPADILLDFLPELRLARE